MSTDKTLRDALDRALKGGAPKYHQKNAEQGKLFARDRIARLVEAGTYPFVSHAFADATKGAVGMFKAH